MERLKRRVASSSSRVIASLQQAATQGFQANPEEPRPSTVKAPEEEDSGASGARLMTADATAHLTEEEREILLQVFKKEEQFQRDTIKQMTASRALQAPRPSNQEALQKQVGVASDQSNPNSSGRGPKGSTNSPNSSFASASSATPLSRPGSSVFGNQAQQQNRTASSCSNNSSNNDHNLGQCRICRKIILANESCHLCSNCNQFICEDCASYSATDKHWMCSSCRRRATKPAIPADTLKELGLNQNSSPVRRMTLRLNKNDLKSAINKGSSESTTSSNSSSGCSSMSVRKAAAATASQAKPDEQLQRTLSSRTQRHAHALTTSAGESGESPVKQQHCDTRSVGQQQSSRAVQQQATTDNKSYIVAEQNVAAKPDLVEPSSRSRALNNGSTMARSSAVVNQRRASAAIADLKQPASGLTRKQSSAFYTQNTQDFQQFYRQHFPRSQLIAPQQPQTLITASSDVALNSDIMRRSSVQQQQQQQQQQHHLAASTLNPMGSDQIHLRRLSDQSNLIRRSSIIADTLDNGLIVRNRSHSNIDSVLYANNAIQQSMWPQQQQQQTNHGYSDDNMQSSYNYAPKVQWSQQHVPEAYLSYENQRRASSQQPLTSIITPYSQKRHNSSDELHSDSSSDIEDAAINQANVEFENEQPSEYFAPPRAPTAHLNYQEDLIHQVQQAPISIPSVSVSYFRSSQQRLNQQSQQNQLDQIMTTPMEINVAIEQAIMQQQQQQTYELQPDQNYGHLLPRRGSSGRILPKIPGEQSRSLLDLPHNNSSTNPLDTQAAMLDLPVVSPTIRRASAPEGQNIKIVVDDIDGSMRASCIGKPNMRQGYQKQAELYERLVLYRDDSLDPNTNMARGFGLHVTGGKIQPDDTLQAVVSWTLANGPADKVGLKRGDFIIDWDGKCLMNMSYEQVADVIESSANIAELLVKPANRLESQPGTNNYVRSQRRLSQQTENDLRKIQQQNPSYGLVLDQAQASNMVLQSQQQQQRLTGQFQVSTRTGTGRRLPQIPPAFDASGKNPDLLRQHEFSSTGQLDHSARQYWPTTNQLNGFEPRDGSRLSATNSQHNNSSSPGSLITLNSAQWNNQQPLINSRDPYQMQHSSQNLGVSHLSTQDEICAFIGLRVNVDERINQLEISILSAINIKLNTSLDYQVRVRILPESNRFKLCKTLPSSDMNWKETFLFQNFPTQQIQRMALEIGIWVHDEAPRLSTQIAQPICEAMIPIQSARERNTDFWPLRPPPTSPQARRKSLNDLIVLNSQLENSGREAQLSAGHTSLQAQWSNVQPDMAHRLSESTIQVYDNKYQPNYQFTRERSSSNRNLPDTTKLRVQPRRASDEVAGSSSQKYLSRVSPAQSRRSISVMNVGEGSSIPNRSSSRLGSQSNILKLRRDSNQIQMQQQQQPQLQQPLQQQPASGQVASESSAEQQPVGVTPSGRKSSLVGIQSMAGYRSQKSSQSDATDQKATSQSFSSQKRSQPNTPPQTALASGTDDKPRRLQHRASVVSITPSQVGTSGSSGSRRNSSSRRSSTEHTPQLQRKGSFAMITLQKLKRTMSLTKSSEAEQSGSNQESRQSSFSSNDSTADLNEDLGVTRRIVAHTAFVGKLKLSFVMTKGQLEVEVICAEGLKFDYESSLGVYVKMYLKGKNKSNKRKTRIVQAWESPIFKQVIKYDASLVDNKSLEVSVWHKQGGLKGKLPIGFTEIRMSELSLGQLQVSWYNLRSMDVACSSSVED